MTDEMIASMPDAQNQTVTLRFDEHGLIPVVAQDASTRAVVLLAYMNAEALEATRASGLLTLWSRSRGALWRKGETSGHMLRVVELRINCEENSLLAMVELAGAGACHKGYRTCYYRALSDGAGKALMARVVEPRAFDPADIYPASDDDTTLERDARALYAAYERLRDDPPAVGSRTSDLLRAADPHVTSGMALGRAAEELEELRGVIAGTHRHHGDERDVLLEASQVGYWTMLAAIAERVDYGAWLPHRAWLRGWREGAASADRSEAPENGGRLLDALQQALSAAGALCRAAGIHPARALAADLADMRRKHAIT